jgi:hypothetical protein
MSFFRRSGADVLSILSGGTGAAPAIRWLSGAGFYEAAGNVSARATQFLIDIAGTVSHAVTATFAGPINAAAGVMTSGQAAERWGGFFNAGQEAQNLVFLAVSTVLTPAQRYAVFSGTDLDATLPPNPTNGTLHTILNIDATAVDVLASAGDTIDAQADISLAQGESGTYAFRSSTRVWYQVC